VLTLEGCLDQLEAEAEAKYGRKNFAPIDVLYPPEYFVIPHLFCHYFKAIYSINLLIFQGFNIL
jgi:hypothetical protein